PVSPGHKREWSHAEFPFQPLSGFLKVESLHGKRDLFTASCIPEFAVPADFRLLPVQRGLPPGARWRVQIGLHVGPAVALNLKHAALQALIHAAFGGNVILACSKVVDEGLLKRRNHTTRFAVDKTRTYIDHEKGFVLH